MVPPVGQKDQLYGKWSPTWEDLFSLMDSFLYVFYIFLQIAKELLVIFSLGFESKQLRIEMIVGVQNGISLDNCDI